MRNLTKSRATGVAVGLASFLVLATAPARAQGPPPTFPEDTYDVAVNGDTVQLTTKGGKDAAKHAFQVGKNKGATPAGPSIAAVVSDKASGKSATFELLGGGAIIQATRGNSHVLVRITHAGVQISRYVGARPNAPEHKLGPQPVDAPNAEASCVGSDAGCIAGAIRRVIPDLSPEEIGALIVLLRDDLGQMNEGGKILATLTKLAGR